MKTITKKYKVYTLDELSEEAKEKALRDWNQDNDYPFLQADLREYIHEGLQELGLEEVGVITPLYSLTYSQGDGLMFEGTVSDRKGNTYTIKHSGRYYHERSTEIDGQDEEGEEIDSKDFEENVYVPLCKRVAQRGYDEIEHLESMENFQEACDANEYTFLEDGKMFNE